MDENGYLNLNRKEITDMNQIIGLEKIIGLKKILNLMFLLIISLNKNKLTLVKIM